MVFAYYIMHILTSIVEIGLNYLKFVDLGKEQGKKDPLEFLSLGKFATILTSWIWSSIDLLASFSLAHVRRETL